MPELVRNDLWEGKLTLGHARVGVMIQTLRNYTLQNAVSHVLCFRECKLYMWKVWTDYMSAYHNTNLRNPRFDMRVLHKRCRFDMHKRCVSYGDVGPELCQSTGVNFPSLTLNFNRTDHWGSQQPQLSFNEICAKQMQLALTLLF